MKLCSFFKPKQFSRPVEYGIVAAILGVFTGVAFATIGSSSVWFDEAFGAYMIRFNFAEIFHFTSLDVHPPLYYWLLKIWSFIFGSSDVALRSMSLFFALVALLFGYLLLRKMFGQKVALATLPLVALSPVLVRYAQEMRMYTMVLAIGLAATYVLLLIREKPTRNRWILYGVLVALGMWTHYFTALIWLGHWVWRAIEVRQKGLKKWCRAFFTKEWILVHVWAVALFAPWLPWLVKQTLVLQAYGFWISAISPITIPSYLSTMFVYQPAGHTNSWLTVLLILLFVLVIYLFVVIYRTAGRGDKFHYRLLIVSAVAPVAILMLLSLPPLRSTFIDRYLLTASIFLVILVALAIVKAPKKLLRVRIVTAALLVGLSVVGISNVYYYGNFNMTSWQKSNTKQLVQAIRDSVNTSGQPILMSSPWLYYEAAPYGDSRNGVYFIDKDVQYNYGSLAMLEESDIGKVKNLDAFLDSHQTFWYIGRPGDKQLDPPASNLTVLKEIDLPDSITGKAAYKAVQYQVTAE